MRFIFKRTLGFPALAMPTVAKERMTGTSRDSGSNEAYASYPLALPIRIGVGAGRGAVLCVGRIRKASHRFAASRAPPFHPSL
jgi:hypothetical protein